MFVDIINNNLSLHLKQSFPPTISLFIEGEGDGIKSRLPVKTYSTLLSESKPPLTKIAQDVEGFEKLHCSINVQFTTFVSMATYY